MKTITIAIASDHSGHLLKTKIIEYFIKKDEFKITDLGTNNDEVVDYPDYAKLVVDNLLEDITHFGILICGTGIGMSIAANRSSGIRAALCLDLFMAERARSHNDANILVLASKITDYDLAIQIVDEFFSTNFDGGRHSARLAKIT